MADLGSAEGGGAVPGGGLGVCAGMPPPEINRAFSKAGPTNGGGGRTPGTSYGGYVTVGTRFIVLWSLGVWGGGGGVEDCGTHTHQEN